MKGKKELLKNMKAKEMDNIGNADNEDKVGEIG